MTAVVYLIQMRFLVVEATNMKVYRWSLADFGFEKLGDYVNVHRVAETGNKLEHYCTSILCWWTTKTM